MGSHGRPALTSEYIRTHRVTDCQANVIPYMCHCLSDVSAATLVCSWWQSTFRHNIPRRGHRTRLPPSEIGGHGACQSRCVEHSSTSCPDCEAPATPSDPAVVKVVVPQNIQNTHTYTRARTHTPEHAQILSPEHARTNPTHEQNIWFLK